MIEKEVNSQVPNQVHDINWGALDHASRECHVLCIYLHCQRNNYLYNPKSAVVGSVVQNGPASLIHSLRVLSSFEDGL